MGVGYTTGAWTLGGSLTKAEGSKLTNMQARYALSKRTNAYFGMGNEVATLVSSGKDVTIKQTIAGLRHSF
jgi:predicted porin